MDKQFYAIKYTCLQGKGFLGKRGGMGKNIERKIISFIECEATSKHFLKLFIKDISDDLGFV